MKIEYINTIQESIPVESSEFGNLIKFKNKFYITVNKEQTDGKTVRFVDIETGKELNLSWGTLVLPLPTAKVVI